MYFLNDKHPKYEYALFTQIKNGLPYITELRYVTKQNDLLRVIEEIEKKHNRYSQKFYIDNDFYDNYYSLETGGTYYKFLKRKVSDWEVFEELENLENLTTTRTTKVLNFY